MEVRRCMKCMHPLTAGETVCPECGRAYGSVNAETFALKPGTILEGKYLVGEMLGQGGFGITYIGFDLLLEQKVAIKEYYPMSTGMVSREGHSTVVWSSAMMGKTGTQKGFDSFLKEARKMAKLGGIPGVVGVKSVFIQNETAYIVMDFIEGETLLKKLQKNGPMDFDSCVKLMTPIMQALAEVHEHGIIHRDISPDNIMVRPDGKLILLDLGAAKDLDIQGNDGSVQSSQMVAKHGFSPIEQYSKSGKVGPWTDIYAMAATIYYCCTGILPPPATDRTIDDTLACQPLLTQAQFDILADCMRMRPQDRPQSMDTLLQMLTHPQGEAKAEPFNVVPEAEPPKPVEPKTAPPKPAEPKEEPVKAKPAVPQPPLTWPEDQPVHQSQPDAKQKRSFPAWWAAVVVIVLGIIIGVARTSSTVAETPSTAAEVPSAGAYTMVQTPYTPGDVYFWGQTRYKRSDVKAITFQNAKKNIPSTAWDVSAAGDRSVVAWIVSGNLHVASTGKIAPNSDASCMFAYFTNLTEIDFGGCLDTSNVTNMRNMFYECGSLTGLDLSGFDTSKVTNMRSMFSSCSSLSKLDLSGFDSSNVRDMKNMFYGCDSLKSLICTDSKILAEYSAPASSLSSDANVMAKMSSASGNSYFWGQTKYTRSEVKAITFQNVKKNIPITAWDVSAAGDRSVLAWMVSGNLHVAAAGEIAPNPDASYMFARFTYLEKIDFGDCFDTSNVTDMNDMFHDCSSLTSLNLTGFDTSNVTNMVHMFSGCSNLTSLNLTDFDTSNVTGMSYMFSRCGSLTSLDLTGFDTSNVRNMKSMFSDCSSLVSLDLTSFDTANVVTAEYMFARCRNLTSLDLSSFDSSSPSVVYDIFSGCGRLTNLKCYNSKILELYNNHY